MSTSKAIAEAIAALPRTRIVYGTATGDNTVPVEGDTTAVEMPAIVPVKSGDYCAVAIPASGDRIILGPIDKETFLPLDGSGEMTGDLDMGGNDIDDAGVITMANDSKVTSGGSNTYLLIDAGTGNQAGIVMQENGTSKAYLRYEASSNRTQLFNYVTSRYWAQYDDDEDIIYLQPAYAETVGSGSEVRIDASGRLRRLSSSERLKTDIEDIDVDLAHKIGRSVAHKWYRSNSPGDTRTRGMFGGIAEQWAEHAHWLVELGPPEGCECFKIKLDDDGEPLPSKGVECSCEQVPVGIDYGRYSIVNGARINDLHGRIETVERERAELRSELDDLRARLDRAGI